MIDDRGSPIGQPLAHVRRLHAMLLQTCFARQQQQAKEAREAAATPSPGPSASPVGPQSAVSPSTREGRASPRLGRSRPSPVMSLGLVVGTPGSDTGVPSFQLGSDPADRIGSEEWMSKVLDSPHTPRDGGDGRAHVARLPCGHPVHDPSARKALGAQPKYMQQTAAAQKKHEQAQRRRGPPPRLLCEDARLACRDGGGGVVAALGVAGDGDGGR
eukprot:gene5262-45908_t